MEVTLIDMEVSMAPIPDNPGTCVQSAQDQVITTRVLPGGFS